MMCAKVSAFKENERHRGCLPVIASSRAAAVVGKTTHTKLDRVGRPHAPVEVLCRSVCLDDITLPANNRWLPKTTLF